MKILLAVSGGIDSMYLANMAPELFPGANFAVAHCNFCLRGEESDADEAFVRDWCERHGMECFVQRFDTAAYAAAHGLSIEMAARDLRYAFFSFLAGQPVPENRLAPLRPHPSGPPSYDAEGGTDFQAQLSRPKYDAVAVAHNANDNAETLLLNMLRGSGVKGLCGMRADSVRVVDGRELRILRPLLGTSRAEIEAWMKTHNESWREDHTNAETIFKRNMLRHEVLPVFERINPAYLRTLARDMEHLSEVNTIADEYYESVLVTLRPACPAVCDAAPDIEGISVDKLLAARHWEYVLWRLLEPHGFSYETLEKLSALLRRFKEEPRGTVTLGGKTFEGHATRLTISRGRFHILPR